MIGIGLNIGNRVMGGGAAPATLLLDAYPSAAVAFSVRKLRTAYTGSAIRVRRSSDNAEQDIGFTALGNLDTSTLTSFCGSSDGFVTTWYDQSGNARNVTQTTAAWQPQIVSSGSVLLVNGKPAILSLNKRLLNASQPNINPPVSDFYAYKVDSFSTTENYQTFYDGGSSETNRGYFGYQKSNGFIIIYDAAIVNGYVGTLNQQLATNIRNGFFSEMYKNNVYQASGFSGSYNPFIGLMFGQDYGGGAPSNVYHQEFIRYSGVSSNISAINTNINTYYGIY